MDWLRLIAKVPGALSIWHKMPVGSVDVRVRFDIWDRPAYAYGVYSAAGLARQLGLKSISAIEFGVARGEGLLALERICERVGSHFGMEIAVFGLDSGKGMPAPCDYRDLPYVWNQGFYAIDEEALRKKLRRARLVIGDVAKTAPELIDGPDLPPVGFISFDLDYYSSTKQAFRILGGPQHTRLPRVFCYFDDILWPERACYNEFTGELLAIREFNTEHETRKLGKLPHLKWMRAHPAAWNEQIYVFHDFQHPQYSANITPPDGRQ